MREARGLDGHQKTVVACILQTETDGTVHREVHRFGTMTADLLALNDWLNARRVEQVAMESTGVYWRPVFNLLEADHAIILVNAQHRKAVPGHKTDVKDAEWLADLLRHGRHARQLHPAGADPRAARVGALSPDADGTNARRRSTACTSCWRAPTASWAPSRPTSWGTSGRAMLEAILSGEQRPETVADLARGRLRAKLPQLRQALEGRVQAQHRMLIHHVLAHIDFLEGRLAHLASDLEETLAPCAEAVALLETIPCVGHTAAVAIVAEIGPDMGRFPSAKHLASWAGVCPGNRQSAGKRLGGKTTYGDTWLRAVLGEVAWSLAHTSTSYLAAQYHRLARRCGKHKAIVAVCHSLLVVIYHMLRHRRPYQDLGPDYFDRLDTTRLQRHYVRRLEQLGYAVSLAPTQVA